MAVWTVVSYFSLAMDGGFEQWDLRHRFFGGVYWCDGEMVVTGPQAELLPPPWSASDAIMSGGEGLSAALRFSHQQDFVKPWAGCGYMATQIPGIMHGFQQIRMLASLTLCCAIYLRFCVALG